MSRHRFGAKHGESILPFHPQVAYMLLGAVIFVVSMFYLASFQVLREGGTGNSSAIVLPSSEVNWNDDDIRYYSMNIISNSLRLTWPDSARVGIKTCGAGSMRYDHVHLLSRVVLRHLQVGLTGRLILRQLRF